jgi:hypothetical protein
MVLTLILIRSKFLHIVNASDKSQDGILFKTMFFN